MKLLLVAAIFVPRFFQATASPVGPVPPVHARGVALVNPDLPSDAVMRPGVFKTTVPLSSRLKQLSVLKHGGGGGGGGGGGDDDNGGGGTDDGTPPANQTTGDGVWISPVFTDVFKFPLTVPTTLLPITSFTNETSGEVIDYFEITIQPTQVQIYKDLEITNFEGYDGILPGPLIDIETGRRSVVRFINNVTTTASIHLHGSPSRPPWDGYAADITGPGQYKDYFYPNELPRSLWYHDHSLGITARNAYYGQAGLYIVRNKTQDAEIGLPSGNYEMYIQLSDKIHDVTGQLVSPAGEREKFYGDLIYANGLPWPVWKVEPRKYRIRLLDAAINRTFNLRIETASGVVVPFTVIGTDGGLMEKSVISDNLIIAIAERYEIVLDFEGFEDQTLYMRNARNFSVNPDYAFTDYVMSFNVSSTVTDSSNNGPVPSNLITLPFAVDTGRIDREFTFERTNGDWRINGVGWDQPLSPPVLADPTQGTVEVWKLINKSGGWAHPIHIHLIDFRVLTRTKRGVEPYEATGYKDVVFTAENEQVTVVARYAPWPGVYMFHCHNLIHEDNDMMGVFDVNNTIVQPTQGDLFSNPMEPTFRAVPMDTAAFTAQAIQDKLAFFAHFGAYDKPTVVT